MRKSLFKGLFVLVIMFVSVCAVSTIETGYCKSDAELAKAMMVYDHKYEGLSMDNVEIKVLDMDESEIAYEVYVNGKDKYHYTTSRQYLRDSYKILYKLF